MSNRWFMPLVCLVNVVIVVAFLGGGIDLLFKQETGTAAKARVADCVGLNGRYTTVVCSGTWVVGGSLLGNGHVVVGTVNGADRGEIGKTIDVRLSGGEAYVRSITISLVLIGLGLVWGAIFGYVLFLLR